MLELNGPVIVTLEINDKCSYGQCPGCPRFFKVEEEPLSVTGWEKVINKLDEYVQEYRVDGGEPTEHPDFFDILQILEKTGKYYHIFTHGVWDDPDRILEGLSNCAYVNSITFSLHGQNSEIHNAFTAAEGLESFEKVLDNIRLAYAAGYNVNTNTVITSQNAGHVEEIADLAVDLGAKYSIFSRYIGPKREDIEISSDRLGEVCKEIEELKSLGYNVMLGNCIPHCFYSSSAAGCFAGITYAAVDWAGNLKPCTFSELKAGNLTKDDVRSVWRSRKMRAWRKRMPDQCKKCTKLSVCPGGCKAVADILGTPVDPLIGEPIPKSENPPVLDVTLEEDLCPRARYVTRSEDFGWILIHGSQVVPVSHRAEKILKSIDGSTTLGEIESKFGAGALSFIYSLYIRDFVEFRVKTGEEEKV